VRRNSPILVQRLIEADIKPKFSVSKQCSLHVALQEDRKLNIQKIKSLVLHCKEYINVKDENENTPLLLFFIQGRTGQNLSLLQR